MTSFVFFSSLKIAFWDLFGYIQILELFVILSVKNSIRILIEIALNLQIILDIMDI